MPGAQKGSQTRRADGQTQDIVFRLEIPESPESDRRVQRLSDVIRRYWPRVAQLVRLRERSMPRLVIEVVPEDDDVLRGLGAAAAYYPEENRIRIRENFLPREDLLSALVAVHELSHAAIRKRELEGREPFPFRGIVGEMSDYNPEIELLNRVPLEARVQFQMPETYWGSEEITELITRMALGLPPLQARGRWAWGVIPQGFILPPEEGYILEEQQAADDFAQRLLESIFSAQGLADWARIAWCRFGGPCPPRGGR